MEPCRFLVKHTAEHPNSCSVVQTLDLHKLERIGCRATRLVEMAGIEPASENLSVSASPSADALLKFPCKSAKRQADLLSSLNSVTAAEALRRSRSPLK